MTDREDGAPAARVIDLYAIAGAVAAVERGALGSLMVQLDRLREQALDPGAVFILPPYWMPGLTSVYGVPVVRAEVTEPMVAIPGARHP